MKKKEPKILTLKKLLKSSYQEEERAVRALGIILLFSIALLFFGIIALFVLIIKL